MSDLLTSTQAGPIIDKSARTVSRLAETGELSFSMKLPGPNGAYLFSQADLDAFLAKPDTEPA